MACIFYKPSCEAANGKLLPAKDSQNKDGPRETKLTNNKIENVEVEPREEPKQAPA